MIIKINSKEIESLISCPGEKRYTYFVKRVVDREEVWGLYHDGWALASTDDGVTMFPFWPAPEYAGLCAEGSWEGFEPRSIPPGTFLNELLPKLRKDGLVPGIFYTPDDRGVTPDIDQLMEDIRLELAKYEY